MNRWSDHDWDRATEVGRQVAVSLVMAWALFQGIGWLVAWKLCGCAP